MEIENTVYHIKPFNGFDDIQIEDIDGNFAIGVKGRIILKDKVLNVFRKT